MSFFRCLLAAALIASCTTTATVDAPTRTTTSALGSCDICPPIQDDLDPAVDIVHYELVAARNDTGAWQYSYNGTNPGPTLVANVGDRVIVDFTNQLGEPSTIHWHGMHVPFDMDGVAWMRAPVGDGESYRYEFVATKSGTFWYHPHFNTNAQVEGGLYGAFVVNDPAEPAVDDDIVLFVDDASERAEPHTVHGHGALSRDWRTNGDVRPTLTFDAGSVVRARLINVSGAGYAAISWPGMEQIASDQGLLPQLVRPERVVLGPADRAEFVWRLAEEGFTGITDSYSLNGGDTALEPSPLFDVEVSGTAAAAPMPGWPFEAADPSDDPTWTDIVYVLVGSDRTGDWRINGERFPDVTIQEIELGSTAIIEVRNLSPTEHPFHLHGMAFEVLSIDGEPPAYRTIEDSLNIGIRQTVRLRVEATNPGDWMTHCHILPHAEDGMMTVLRVTE